jgi:hypothetical protein
MKTIKIKTWEQLLSEGWKRGSFTDRLSRNTTLYLGPSKKDRVFSLSYYQEENVLGKEVRLIDFSMEQPEPQFRIQIGVHKCWLPWIVIDGNTGPHSMPRTQTKFIGGGKISYTPTVGFHLDHNLDNVTEEVAFELASHILKKLKKRK